MNNINASVDGDHAFWDSKGAVAIAFVVGVVAVWAALGWYASTKSQPGTFGDMFGGASALFSGLAFAGLVYTIALQRSELASQRRYLAEHGGSYEPRPLISRTKTAYCGSKHWMELSFSYFDFTTVL